MALGLTELATPTEKVSRRETPLSHTTIRVAESSPQSPIPWVETPCPENKHLSVAAGCHIYTKLEYAQPSGSFKSRGIGNRLYQCVQSHKAAGNTNKIHFYSCSAGNAGLAAATAATLLAQLAVVVVPNTTTILMQSMIEAAGAKVIVHGTCIAECDELVRELVNKDPSGVYVSPFDHADIWAGNSTLIDELYEQLNGEEPDAVVCSVGGGGLLNGVLLGLDRYGWNKTTVLAVETEGADSLSRSLLGGELITLPKITSIAKSLGVNRVSRKTWELIEERNARSDDTGRVVSFVLSDAEAAMACVRYTGVEGVVIEPACGVSVAGAYNGLFARAIPGFSTDSKIAVVVCGGSTVNMKDVSGYTAEYSSQVEWST